MATTIPGTPNALTAGKGFCVTPPTTSTDGLVRVATSDGLSGRGAAAKVRALVALVALGDESPLPISRLRAELTRVAVSGGSSGRSLVAAVAAIGQLDELDGTQALEYPVAPAMRRRRASLVGSWPFYTQKDLEADPFGEVDYVAPRGRWTSDLWTYGGRDDLRVKVQGLPPWRHKPGRYSDEA